MVLCWEWHCCWQAGFFLFVITAAKDYGATGVGVDLNPVRIKEAREMPLKPVWKIK